MVPSSSRQVLVWSLPTLAFLLSLLWYRRKRRASLRSDPGGTTVDTASTAENLDPQVEDLQKSTSSLPVEKNLASEEVVCDTVTIVHSGITLHINKPRTSYSMLGEDIQPIETSSEEIETNFQSVLGEEFHPVGNICEPVLEEKIQPNEASSIYATASVECSNLKEFENDSTLKEIDRIQEAVITNCAAKLKDSSEDPIEKETEVITVETSANNDLQCLKILTNGVNEDLSIAEREESCCKNTNYNESYENTDVDDTCEALSESCSLFPEYCASEISDNTEQRTEQKQNIEVIVKASLNNKISDEDCTGLKESCNEEQDKIISERLCVQCGETDVQILPLTLNIEDDSNLVKSVDSVLLKSDIKSTTVAKDKEEVEDNESISSVDSFSVATTVMARKSSTETSTLEKQTHEDENCKKSVAESVQQNDSVSLECKLSTMELDGDATRDASSDVNNASTNGGMAAGSEHRGNERDSANHSPADVMLASPSISSYSDAQSEGSSDSGKGCSDVATPPSRTPASGSSLSGDVPVPSVYEFVLPQHLVGRLIGRHGCFVHQIKDKTNASILIKRHPDTQKLKICAVEGTQADIESALEMIRQKFPAKRYPNVTLDQVCFLPPVPTFPLIPECLQLQLVEGVNNDVILSSLVSPAHFFLQQPTHPTFPALNRLNACMNMCYSEPSAPLLPLPTQAGVICAAPTMGGWYRAQVVAADAESDVCDIKFVDYGGYLTIENSALRQIRSDFMTLPFQASECYLANVTAMGDDEEPAWSKESIAGMEELTHGQVLQAQVCGYAEDGLPVVYLYAIHGSQVVLVNQELVSRGLAEWVEQPEA